MGKKGSKRKTRWRTLSIDAPPGDEDEEDDLRNGYVKGQQNGNSPHGFDRNGQGEYKPRRSTVGSSSSSGYTNGSSKARRDESTGSPSQSNNIFNEDEYTRITTPRQDILFKKSYLSRKKPWAGNASTSATPSTTESHSASHSTAGRDGSETTEYQQLLDRDNVTGKYPDRVDPGAQVGYGTFYDHASPCYCAYPMMLVGPAPIPTEVGPSVLAALPCGSVPLKPVEWIDPAFVPKLSGQSYCLMNNEVHYQSGNSSETNPMMDREHDNVLVPEENLNGSWNENGVGSASCSGSVVEEIEEQRENETNVTKKITATDENNPTEELFQDACQGPPMEETDGNGAPYLEPMVMPQPAAIHMSHVISAVPQPYMYPGHYMFGPPLVNVNGVTIQEGPMIRTTNVTVMDYTKQKKKKKKRKPRVVALDNAEEDKEGYSSDGESGLSSSRTSWSMCPSLSTTTITTATTTATTTTKSRPLNPECKEFQIRPVIKCDLSTVINSSTTSEEADQLLRANTSSLNNEEGISSNNGDNYDNYGYSSDGESGLSSSRTSWSTCPSLSTTTITTATTTATTTTTKTSRPLNPDCKEFQLRPVVKCDLSTAINSSTTSEEADQLLRANTSSLNNEEGISSNNGDNYESKYNNNPCEDVTSTEQEAKAKESRDPTVQSMTTNQAVIDSSTNAENRLINYLSDDNEIVSSKETADYVINDARTESNEASQRTDINNVADSLFSANEICEQPASDVTNFSTKLYVERDKEPLSNGQVRSNRLGNDTETIQLSSDSIESTAIMENGDLSEIRRSSRSSSSQLTNEGTILSNNIDTRQVQDSSDSSSTRESTRKKYSAKTIRFIREPTPGPNLSDECDTTENVENIAQTVVSSKIESTPLIKKNTEAEDLISSESASETGKDNADNKTASEDVAEGSNDSGFETQTRHPEYRIMEAVTEWLRRVNSPDVFVTAAMISDCSDSKDEDLNDEPPKNLQSNPMPALSVNSMADDRVSSCTASCSEFAKINNIEEERHAHNNKNDHQSAVVTLRRTNVRGSKRRSAERFARQVESNNSEHTENGVLSSSDSCHQQESTVSTTTLRKRNLLRKDVVGLCEFTEKDSVAGMRVATSSRINSKRSTSRRARRLDKSSRRPAESLDMKIRRINEPLGTEDEGISDDGHRTMSVKTFEKGEIVVSVDGKFLQISPFARLLQYVENNVSKNTENKVEEINFDKKITNSSEELGMERLENKKRRSSDEEDEIDKKMTTSLTSIEEPDVLECWEVETIEPIRTPKKMLQSHGVLYEGEAAEEDHFQAEPAIVEHVQKYYRLARESATSIEDESYESKINVLLETKPFNKSRMVPNSPVELIRGYQGEEIPVIMPNEKYGILEERKIPVDEAFEVYESCYTDRTQSSTLDSIFKPRPLYRQEGEGPVPCRAVCCSIQ